MTTLQQIELQCPVCETRFRSQAVVSTNSFGGKRTDFHERAAGTQFDPEIVRVFVEEVRAHPGGGDDTLADALADAELQVHRAPEEPVLGAGALALTD